MACSRHSLRQKKVSLNLDLMENAFLTQNGVKQSFQQKMVETWKNAVFNTKWCKNLV